MTQEQQARDASSTDTNVAPTFRAERAERPPWMYIGVLLLSTFLMGSSFVVGKILLRSVAPFPLAGWRFVLAAAATLPLVVIGRASRVRHSERPSATPNGVLPMSGRILLVLLIGLLQTTAVIGLIFWALQFISAGEASILLFTNPLLVALLAPWLLHERLRLPIVLGLLLGLGGVALALGAVPHGQALAGDVAALLAALAWALVTLLTKRIPLGMSAWELNFWQMLVGAGGLLAVAALTHEQWQGALTPLAWGEFLWLAIPASTGAFGLWFLALRWGGAARTSSYLFLVPFFSVVLAHVFLGEQLGSLQVLGGVLIAVALVLINRVPAHTPPPIAGDV